jgi:hypothetical protein
VRTSAKFAYGRRARYRPTVAAETEPPRRQPPRKSPTTLYGEYLAFAAFVAITAAVVTVCALVVVWAVRGML